MPDYEALYTSKVPFDPTEQQLDSLAEFMAQDVPQENSNIPAGYTYLGQFIDHDVSLESDFLSGNFPLKPIMSSKISNLRSPFLDLEIIYGDTPSEPDELKRKRILKENSNSLLELGETIAEIIPEKFLNDLPRLKRSATANIIDQRNDENLAIAQTHVAFIKFHNAIAEYLLGGGDTAERFEQARILTIHHYQWVILYDFLPRIIDELILQEVIENQNRTCFPQINRPTMPLEFSVAAYRFGHSLIRDSYQWNRLINDDQNPTFQGSLANLTLFTGGRNIGGREHLPSDWLINWNLFYNIDNSITQKNFNCARKIDTKISSSLGFLNPSGGPVFNRLHSLPAMDLYRGRAYSLVPGQVIAEVIGRKQDLAAEQIAELLPEDLKNDFSKNTPLWFYLLAEAEINQKGEKMDEIGSRIIAETLVGLLRLDRFSILNNDFKPEQEMLNEKGQFGMPELLKFIAQHNKVYDELNPIG